MSRRDKPSFTDHLSNAAFSLVMRRLMRLPYDRRIPAGGRLLTRLAPVLGYSRRIRANLALACPDLSEPEVNRLVREVPDNIGRCLAEMYSGEEFLARIRDVVPEGPGAAHLAHLRDTGRPCVLVTGHFGNYDVMRGALVAQGYPIGALYRPMNNSLFNEHYLEVIHRISEPLFARDRRGMSSMIRHLKSGGMIGLAADQYFRKGAVLQFFGQPAPSPLSSAELALKLGVDMMPIYSIREPDGLSFRIEVEAPIPHTTAEEMTQISNDSLEAQVRKNMDQWLWIHRRWRKS